MQVQLLLQLKSSFSPLWLIKGLNMSVFGDSTYDQLCDRNEQKDGHYLQSRGVLLTLFSSSSPRSVDCLEGRHVDSAKRVCRC